MKKCFNFLNNKKYEIFAWLICFCFVIVAEGLFREAVWCFDALDYWTRGELLKEGRFYLGSIDGFRGYIYPLYLGVINKIGGRTAWNIFNAIIVATFFSWILPQMHIKKGFDKTVLIKVSILCILLGILFIGLLVYPLSDLFAMIIISIATICMKKALDREGIVKFIYIFLVGVFCYLAYNTRTIYMYAGYTMLVVFAVLSFSGKSKKLKSVFLVLGEIVVGSIGCFVAAIPQIIMNYINLGKFCMGVPTGGLMLAQMYWGIQYQRYDTYFVTIADEVHPYPNVFFVDPSGMKLLNGMYSMGFSSWSDYFRLFFTHPVDFILIYVRHFVNYLFPCWPQIYTKNLNSIKWLLGLLGFTLFFITLYVFFEKCIKNYKDIVYYIPLVVPAILIIPGAVEYRFSLAIYVFSICQLLFNVDYQKVKTSFASQKWKSIILYLIFMLLCFTIWSNMLANESITPLLF